MDQLNLLLETALRSQVSDLHLLASTAPILRINGELIPVPNFPPLTKETVKELVLGLVDSRQKEILLNNKEIDFSYDFQGKARFRVNAYFERGRLAAALRLIPLRIKAIEELNLPSVCHRFTQLNSGFILITGPTGHGKSSSLAAIIEEINQTRKGHIITIEDPIEYVYRNAKSIVSQRELEYDTHSWVIALRSVLRQDPDVVLVGEMRDYETIAAALTIAETGHLVFATLHTNSASQTVDRIIDVFPENQQEQVRMQLSNSIGAILSQRLLPALEGGRLPAVEVLLATPAVRATIREGKTHQIDNIIQTSLEQGMISLEKSLADWVRFGKISQEVALSWSLRPEELLRMLKTGPRR